jgi:transposase-like protein
MRQVWTKRSIRQAIKEVKEFEWEGDYRPAARLALKEILEKRMVTVVDEYLAKMEELELTDRRNGSFTRHILTEMGDVALAVARTRTMSAKEVLKAFSRRAPAVDRLILGCFTLGLSTRKVGEALLPLLGERVSASTVSRVAKQLDAAVEAYHRRPLENRYRFLIFDGVVLKKKTGAGSAKRVVLVALGFIF